MTLRRPGRSRSRRPTATHEHRRAARRHRRAGRRRRSRWPSPASRRATRRASAQQRHRHRLRRLWQRGHRLHGHGGLHQQRRPWPFCRRATPSPAADAGTHSFSVTLDAAGTQQSITATDSVDSSLTRDRVGHHGAGGRARQTLAVAGFPTSPTAGTATASPSRAYGCLWQCGRPVTRARSTSAAADPNAGFQPSSYTFISRRSRVRTPSPPRSRRPGSQSITASDTTNKHQRHRDGHHGAVRRARQAGRLRLPDDRIAGRGRDIHGQATDAYGNVIDRLPGHGQP